MQKGIAMNTQTDTSLTIAPQRRASALPAGAGILLAMALGGLMWVGIFALFT